MIEITVRMLPKGNAMRARTMGRMTITNDATGTRTRGNYVVRLFARQHASPYRTAAVTGFPRTRLGVWKLAKAALDLLFVTAR